MSMSYESARKEIEQFYSEYFRSSKGVSPTVETVIVWSENSLAYTVTKVEGRKELYRHLVRVDETGPIVDNWFFRGARLHT